MGSGLFGWVVMGTVKLEKLVWEWIELWCHAGTEAVYGEAKAQCIRDINCEDEAM